MKIKGISQERIDNIERRKEAGNAYRKNAQYFKYDKNPVLVELEKLLSGETDQTQYQEQQEEAPEVKQAIRELQQTEQNVRMHEQAHMTAGGAVTGGATYSFTEGPDGKNYISGGEVSINAPAKGANDDDTIEILEQVKRAALAPANPSQQDLRVAASATVQIQQTKAQKTNNDLEIDEQQEPVAPPYVNETIKAEVPERFMKEMNRDANEKTVFGRTLEEVYQSKLFAYASSRYTSHTEMVKNGYQVMTEPTFSLTA